MDEVVNVLTHVGCYILGGIVGVMGLAILIGGNGGADNHRR